MKNTVTSLRNMKSQGEKISQLTCYDYSTARLADDAGINMILVGDSLGVVMQGYSDTLPVTLDEMIVYGRSVVRACANAMVIVDMPFMSYQISPQKALEAAGRIVKETGCAGVKLEGGENVHEAIKAITGAGIPVVGHIGMTPQSFNSFGGFKVQGKNEAEAEKLLRDALSVQKAGAFAVTLECVPPKLSRLISEKLDIITIGIGAGAFCDGQVLVYQDMLGITDGKVPKFVRQFADIGSRMRAAFTAYDTAVKNRTFPNDNETYAKSDCSDEFLSRLDKEFS